MTTRLVHISDLHFPAADGSQVAALGDAITEARPDAIVITGDVTRRGRRSEFDEANAFLSDLTGPKLIVPGNHDIPVSAFVPGEDLPFRRFERYFNEIMAPLNMPDVVVIGMNTASAARAQLDWSLGDVPLRRVTKAVTALANAPMGKLRFIACHHPLLLNERDSRRSRTRGGSAAFHALAGAGLDGLLHGHLHCAVASKEVWEERMIHIIGANTALAERERGGGSGFNVIDIDAGELKLTGMIWEGGRYWPYPE